MLPEELLLATAEVPAREDVGVSADFPPQPASQADKKQVASHSRPVNKAEGARNILISERVLIEKAK
jgi:hypothetical protein